MVGRSLTRCAFAWPVILSILLSACSSVPKAAQGSIVFVSMRDGDPEIYIMNSDGSNVKRLTNNPLNDFSPALSPDGTRIAFVTNRDGDEEIYSMNVDGSNPRRLTISQGSDNSPAWSPDGKQIAFSAVRNGPPQIYIMNADGSNQKQITSDKNIHLEPAWSPDGKYILYTSWRDATFEIYRIKPDGSDMTRLTANTPLFERSASWSPDGKQILYTCSSPAVAKPTQFINTINGRLFLSTDSNASNAKPALDQICLMQADGSGATLLLGGPGNNWSPTWSTDGQRILFVSDREGKEQLYSAKPNGSEVKSLTQGETANFSPHTAYP